MSEIRVYAILLSVNNRMDVITSRAFAEALGDKKNMAVVNAGIDLNRHVLAIVFRNKKDRDIAGMKLSLMGVKFDTRDDGWVDEDEWNKSKED